MDLDRDRVVGVATGYGLDGPGSRFSASSRTALGPTEPLITMGLSVLLVGLDRTTGKQTEN